MGMRSLFIALLGLGTLFYSGEARVIRVPQDAQTLQGAIQNAQDGDTIQVAGGVYRGEGNVGLTIDRRLVFIAPQGPTETVIDGEGQENTHLFTVNNVPFTLIGFTLTRATAGAINLSSSNQFQIINCHFQDNDFQIAGQGSALRILSSSRGVVHHCFFAGNRSSGSGGAIYATGASQFTATYNVFLNNRSDRFGGAVLTTGADTWGHFVNCLFVSNRCGIDGGGAAVSVNSPSRFAFCTFYDNRAESDNSMGGGFYKGSNSNPEIINSIFWGNQAPVGSQIYGQDNGGVITINYTLIEGGDEELGQAQVGDGLLDDDPQFDEGRDPDWGIRGFFLDPESPAVDAGDDEARAWGVDTLTTRADLVTDRGTADLGFHYDPDDFTRTCFLYGWVSRNRDQEPLPEAEVFTSRGDRTTSDEEGYWEIPQARVGVLTITARKEWFTPISHEVELEEGDTLEVNFALPQPLIALEPQRIDRAVNAGDSTSALLELSNRGDGRLDWQAQTALHPDDEVSLWTRRVNIAASQVTGDPRLNGVAFDGEFFYISGSSDQEHNYIYVLNLQGEEDRRFEQPAQGAVGFRDLEWDGENLWGTDGADLVQFTLEGERLSAIRTNINPLYGVAWDPLNRLIWTSGITSNILAYDPDGNLVRQLNRQGLRQYGFGFYPADPDGYHLYVLHNSGQAASAQVVYKINTATGDTLLVRNLSPQSSGNAGGMVIYPHWDPYSDVLISLVNDGNTDRVEVWQLASNTGWIAVDPSQGSLEGGESTELSLTLSALSFHDGLYRGRIILTHNAFPGATEIPITLEVTGGPVLTQRRLLFLCGWSLVSLNIVPAEDEIPTLFAPLVEQGLLIVVKDALGRFYFPARGNFNNIPAWDPLQGYWVKTTAPAQLGIEGISISPDSAISLSRGWQLASYLPRRSMEVSLAVAPIAERMVIIKDGEGRFYLPSHAFSNMPLLQQGRGYAIKMAEEAELVWGAVPPGLQSYGKELFTIRETPRHFPQPNPTSANMSLYLALDRPLEGEIAVTTKEGLIVGAGVMKRGVCGLAIWGDDPITDQVEGAREGERLSLLFWEGRGEPVSLTGEPFFYGSDRILILDRRAPRFIPDSPLYLSAYPNPFNTSVTFYFSLPVSQPAFLDIYDLRGRQVARVWEGEGGDNRGVELTWEATRLPTGYYFAQLSTPAGLTRVKLLLLR